MDVLRTLSVQSGAMSEETLVRTVARVHGEAEYRSAVQELEDSGLVEVLEKDGRKRTIRVKTKLVSQWICLAKA